MQGLVTAGWDPSFIYLFDEVWLMMHHCAGAIERITGNLPHSDFAAFYVKLPSERGAEEESAGWKPHRDRGGPFDPASEREDGTPRYNTVWIPITDATPENSCLYVLPADRDTTYKNNGHPNDAITSLEALQDIQALPAARGSLISFSHRLLHWGSRAASTATTPRMALSFSFSDEHFETTAFPRDLLPLPPLTVRLALVAGQCFIYAAAGQLVLGEGKADLLFSLFEEHRSPLSREYRSTVEETIPFRAAVQRHSEQSRLF
jgi:hypothetical protein